jgi:tetratricopeptide (TPR) repeat protein
LLSDYTCASRMEPLSSKIQYGMFSRRISTSLFAAIPAALPKLVLLVFVVTVGVAPSATGQTINTDPLNRNPEVVEAFQRFYIMDYEGALSRFGKIQAEHPSDPIATDYILHVTLFKELFRLDLLDTTFYANDGFLTGRHPVVEDPKVRDEIKGLSDKAIDQADNQLKNNVNDINALFARGWARSLEACYVAMVQRSYTLGLKLALGAKNDDERVLEIDPNYADAKMVVGIYQYVVGSLPLGFKLLVGIAGIHGTKAGGMALLQDSADHGVITSVESRTAMMLFLRRDAKYQQAKQIAEGLAKEYPRDFLFALEVANLSKDAGEGMTAIAAYRHVISEAKRPGFFPLSHLELAYFGLADSLRGQKLYAEAADAYREGAYLPTTSPELKRRSLLAAGEVYDLMNEHDKARQEYQAVIDSGSDTVQADQARRFQRAAYTGR